jgi:hypothetical protein
LTAAAQDAKVHAIVESPSLSVRIAAIILAALAPWPRTAHADESEASVHGEVGPAVVRTRVSDAGHASAPTLAPNEAEITRALRLSLRGSWGLSDTWALEVGAGALVTGTIEAPGPPVPGGTSSIYRERPVALRGTLGLTARLGVQWIPTVSIFGGYQLRLATGRTQVSSSGSQVAAYDVDRSSDVLVGAGVGLDYRFGARWVGGISIQAVHAFAMDGTSYDAIEVPIWLAWYWYPRF